MANVKLGGKVSLQSMMKTHGFGVEGEGEDEFEEPTSVLELSQCISPPLDEQQDEWVKRQAQEQMQMLYQQQQLHVLGQQFPWENQQSQQFMWEQLSQPQYLQENKSIQPTYVSSSDPTMNFGESEHVCQDLDPWHNLQCQSLQGHVLAPPDQTSTFAIALSLLDDPFVLDTWIPSSGAESSEESTSYMLTDEASSGIGDSNMQGSFEFQASGSRPNGDGNSLVKTEEQFLSAMCMDPSLCFLNELDDPKTQFHITEPWFSSSGQGHLQAPRFQDSLRQVETILQLTVPQQAPVFSAGVPLSSPVKRRTQTPPVLVAKKIECASPPTEANEKWRESMTIVEDTLFSSERSASQASGSIGKRKISQLELKIPMAKEAERLGLSGSSSLMGGGRQRVGTIRTGGSGGGAGGIVAKLAANGIRMGTVQIPNVGSQACATNPDRQPAEVASVGGSSQGGVKMVQLLLACAEAVACRDSRQANLLIQQLQHMASPYGDAMQRITACFVSGLTARLTLSGPQPFKFRNPSKNLVSEMEKVEGFNLVYRACPYVAFGHFAANSAVLEAFEGEQVLHIVDLGMTNGLQWPYVIYGLANRPGGPPRLLRITGFGLAEEHMKEAGQQLAEVARSCNLPFQFRVVTESLENLRSSMLELRDGEALAVNSVLQLHCVVKESRGSLNSVLQSIHELSPKILTLVEQDASHNGPFFLGRFMESLHYYAAIFDSLDAILPRSSAERVKMEQFYFAEEIKNIVSCEGPARVERHERVDQWRRRMSRAGFQPLPLKFMAQARSWLNAYSCDGYTLSEEKGCLVLGWKGKSIIAASSWRR